MGAARRPFSDGVGTHATFHIPTAIALTYSKSTAFVVQKAVQGPDGGLWSGWTGVLRMIDVATRAVVTVPVHPEGSYSPMPLGLQGVAVSADGCKVFITAGNSKYVNFQTTIAPHVVMIDVATGVATRLAGAVAGSGARDGVHTNAHIYSPRHIDVSADGATVYFVDMHSIRRIDVASRSVTTIAGSTLVSAGCDRRRTMESCARTLEARTCVPCVSTTDYPDCVRTQSRFR